ncbi:MAG: hypothetical protein HRT59_11105 [Crocosphaera sp.]|nr:hypothetical protein [Crocosphaera sp.]
MAWTPVVDDIKKAGKDVSREAKNCVSGGCDPAQVAKKGLKSMFSAATEGASEEVEESVIRAADHIFDNQVDPLLERAGILSKEVITHAGEEAQVRAENIIDYAVKDVVEGFTPWIQEAARIADQFSPEELEEHLIKTSFDRLDQLENKIFQDANLIMDRVFLLAEDVDCRIEGQRKDIRNDIFERLLSRLERASKNEKECAKENKIRISLFSWESIFQPPDFISITKARNDQLYSLNRCIIEKDIIFETTTEKIIQRYSALAGLAAEYRCIERMGDPEIYTRDWLKYKTKSKIWKELYF